MKNTKRIYKGTAAALLTVLALAAVVFIVAPRGGDTHRVAKDSYTVSVDSQNDTQTESPAQDARVRLMCAGDNLIHSGIYKQARARAGGEGYDFTRAYENVAQLLSLADFAVLNQETVIDLSAEPSNFPLFNSPPELGKHMVSLGFDVINHANNHVLDQGVSGAQSTIDFWHSMPDVLLTGLYSDSADMESAKTNTVNGITFSHVGVTEYLNGMQLPQDSSVRVISPVGAGLSREEFYAVSKRLIETAKENSDVVCVSAHFATENITQPSATQSEIVKRLVEFGADIVIGTGPHVLQPVEFVTRADGTRALVMYSLGNFISAQAGAANLVGAVADITVVKDTHTGAVTIESAGLVPIVTHYGNSYSDIHLELFDEYSEVMALTHGVRQREPEFSVEYIRRLLNDSVGEEFIKKYGEQQ